VTALAVAGPLVAGVLPVAGGDRLDPRDLRHERLEIDDTLSPLVQLKSQLEAESPDELFRLEVNGLPAGVDRIRTAALDTYDGAQWSSAGEYRLAGRELPADPTVVGRARSPARVRQHITVLGLDGPFLPALGRPLALDADTAGFDVTSGTLVSAERKLRGYRYEVVSDVGELVVVTDADDLAGLRAPDAPVLDDLRTPPPEVPEQLQNLAVLWASDSDTFVGELLALRDHLLELRYDDSDDAPPGHSYGALLRMLTGEDGEREGYAEQFAAAFALLARERGFATRVAVGYRLPTPGDDGSYTVTEAHAHAWPEVNLEGVGWVAFEPTDVTKIGAPRDPADDMPNGPGDTPGSEGPVERASDPRVIVDDVGSSAGSAARVRDGVALGGAVLVGLAVLVPIASVAAKIQRRHRRRTAHGTTAGVMGAWHETLDRLTEHGLSVQPAHTAAEVAAYAAARFDGAVTAVARLAPLVAVAVYAPFEPSEDAVRRAWDLERETRRELRPVGGWWGRVWAVVNPRPLVRRWRR
jgi:hypothetical protein